MATPRQSPTPASCSGKKRLLERPVDLDSFFSSGLLSKTRFLLMSCTEEGKTLKSVSACHFARDQQQVGEVQSVNRQRNGTFLLEGGSDAQIAKIQSLKRIARLQVKVEVHPTFTSKTCHKVSQKLSREVPEKCHKSVTKMSKVSESVSMCHKVSQRVAEKSQIVRAESATISCGRRFSKSVRNVTKVSQKCHTASQSVTNCNKMSQKCHRTYLRSH